MVSEAFNRLDRAGSAVVMRRSCLRVLPFCIPSSRQLSLNMMNTTSYTTSTVLAATARRVAVAGMTLLACAGCKAQVASQSKTSPEEVSPISAMAARLFAKSEDQWIKVVGSPDGGEGLVAEVAANACDDLTAEAPWKFRVTMTSSFGTWPATIRLSTVNGRPTATTNIENAVIEFAESWRPSITWRKSACDTWSKSGSSGSLQADREVVLAVAGWLAKIAPDCEFREIEGHGWKCNLPTIEPQLAAEEIERVKRVMIAAWSRQPYLLARRVTISLSLADALEGNARDLDRVCRLIVNSLPLELPATLASERWQASACGGAEPWDVRRESAMTGLAKSLAEIEFLRKLFENTSKLGTLTVRVPNHHVPHRAMLVSLMPEQDVAANITREASGIWGPRGSGQTPKSCWHPIYGESPRLLELATQLDLSGDSSSVHCREGLKADIVTANAPAPDVYLAESITSDTEFVVNNGEAKMLRLPMGSYRYSLKALPENPTDWNDSEATEGSAGTITWDRKRPRQAIRTW